VRKTGTDLSYTFRTISEKTKSSLSIPSIFLNSASWNISSMLPLEEKRVGGKGPMKDAREQKSGNRCRRGDERRYLWRETLFLAHLIPTLLLPTNVRVLYMRSTSLSCLYYYFYSYLITSNNNFRTSPM